MLICSAITSGTWFGSLIPPAPRRMSSVSPIRRAAICCAGEVDHPDEDFLRCVAVTSDRVVQDGEDERGSALRTRPDHERSCAADSTRLLVARGAPTSRAAIQSEVLDIAAKLDCSSAIGMVWTVCTFTAPAAMARSTAPVAYESTSADRP